ncbi:unnamed protein product [Mycena citricolor]|nr:unnamed protein product [Mycena citricolor]
MSGGQIDELMDLWAAREGGNPPFANHDDLYSTIDAIEAGHIPWQSFEVTYIGDVDPDETTPWKTQAHTVYFRDPRLLLHAQLGNPDFQAEMDYAPKQVYREDGKREYKDFMSGNWSWRQAETLASTDPQTHGATFVPVILGSDKTTVSVATGQNEYYPLYISNGLIHNNVRRAHRNGVMLVGFLAIPKTDREHESSPEFRTFRRQLFHSSLENILNSLKPAMTTPEVVRFGDGHFRKVIYGLGPYIADYPEQVLLACVVQGWCAICSALSKDLDGPGGRRAQRLTEHLFATFEHKKMWDDYGVIPDVLPFTWDFPHADIHELLSPDILHQLVKGTFKDHLVAWVEAYLIKQHGTTRTKEIMADIDRRIAAAPAFPGLRRFPEGRGFKQWTGDDSKALMKVYLPAIEGHVPDQMVRAFSAFLDFCYLVRRSVITEDTLAEIDAALARYHHERSIFKTVATTNFSLPRQHSLTHYRRLIQEFGAPNGLCSSITESKHIKAVKEPWRRSSRYQALGQMLTINDRLDRLAAARVDFTARGMLLGPSAPKRHASRPILTTLPTANDDEDVGPVDDDGILGEVKLAHVPARGYPRDPRLLAQHLRFPDLPDLIRRFLFAQENPDDKRDLQDVHLPECPPLPSSVKVYPSAVATFLAPSDQSGIGGLMRERIRSTRSWRGGPARHDCVFVEGEAGEPGFRGLMAARVMLFMSIKHDGMNFDCALVTWFSTIGDDPCPNVGMWMVEPDVDAWGRRIRDIVHIDTILRSAHLLPIFGNEFLPHRIKHTDSLDNFKAFYINKYADHHSHEIAF